MTRYLIVGSGAAGIGAVEGIRSLDPSGEITLLAEEKEGYYSRPGLAYYLTNEITESQLFPFTEADFRRLKVLRQYGWAERINLVESQVILREGKRLAYDRLLVATGAAAARTQAPGMDSEGVVVLDNIESTRRILKMTRRARVAVVVGGGITALEIVEGLTAHKIKAHYLLRGSRYWSNVLDAAESKIIEDRLQAEGVKIHYHTELAQVVQKNGRLKQVLTKDGQTIACQILGIAIGVLPRLDLARSSGLQLERGILVDEHLQTSHPGVFAAGDVAQVYDPFSGKHTLDSLWGPARQQGTVAGKNMAAQIFGQPMESYVKRVAFNVTRLAGLTTTIIGAVGNERNPEQVDDLISIARGDSEVWREIPDAIACQGGFSTNHMRLVVGKKTLLGAVVMGDQTLSLPLQHLVTEQVDITAIRDDLLREISAPAEVIAGFWAKVNRN